MFLRWVHNIWKYFWRAVLVLLLFMLVVGGGVFGVLQLDTSKNYIAAEIEDSFNNRYRGELAIGDLDGLMPFRFELSDVVLKANAPADSDAADSVVTISRLNTQIDLWSLLQNKLSIIDFKVNSPVVRMLADGEGGYTMMHAFRPRTGVVSDSQATRSRWIEEIEIIAPLLTVENGLLYVERFYGTGQNLSLPEPFMARNVNTTMFLEISDIQRFLDFEYFSADLNDLRLGSLTFSGQIYNDSRFLEFNAFNITTPRSELTVSGQIDGVNLEQEENTLWEQVPSAHFDLDFNSDKMTLSEFSDLFPKIPAIEDPLDFVVQAEGDTDTLYVDRLNFGVGESFVSIDGLLNDWDSRDLLNYHFKVRSVNLRKRDLEAFAGPLNQGQFNFFENLHLDGTTMGTADSLKLDLNLNSPHGQMGLNGYTLLVPPYRYNASLAASGVNLGPISEGVIDTTHLNFDASINGIGHDLYNDLLNFNASFYDSQINNQTVEELRLEASLIDGFLEHQYRYRTGQEQMSGEGWIDFTLREKQFALKGDASNIDLSRLFTTSSIPQTRLNLDYNVELQGLEYDRIQGRANLDVKPSTIANDTIRAHQIYMDLDSPDRDTRNFRLTSTLFDLNLSGDIIPSNMYRQAVYWSSYLRDRVKEEILLDSLSSNRPIAPEPEPLTLNGELITKDVSLIQHYVQDFPQVITSTRLNFDLRADSTRLLLSADSRTDTLNYNSTESRGATARLTASFRHDRLLKEFSNIDFRTEIDSIHTGITDMGSIRLDFALKQDSLFFSQSIENISNEARSRIQVSSKVSESLLSINIDDFFIGNESYAWQNERVPTISMLRDGRVQFEDFRFRNNNELIELRGSITENRRDSLLFNLRDVNLSRISDLINGRISFSGRLNGTLNTRSLISSPAIQGGLTVQRLTLDERLIGDARFSSRFNPAKNRFDTQISIVTDSARYPDYLAENDNTGQQIYLDGYFVPPRQGARQDTVFYFDTNFNEIDMWIVPLIAPKVFQVVEGRANGDGYITGNLEEYDFHVDFKVDNAFVKPEFLNTNYFLDGHVVFDRQDWLVFDAINVTDTKGGTGQLNGSVDLNNFSPITYTDLSLDLNRLHFLNNSYDPDVPFYGSISGTGTVRLSGLNNDMFLRTLSPLEVTTDSKLSIPLLEETELNENAKFIQFVDNFEAPGKGVSAQTRSVTPQDDRAELNRMLENLTFSERFNLDLQFNAGNPMTVELIFDQVTGEVLTAAGTGRVRLTMEEEEVQIFGRYNISSGRYMFVGGEIFTRPLELESGGAIVWEGEPDDARLNINAVYHARPSIAPLRADATAQPGEGEFDGQRVPIDLVVEITGTISTVENNYYFRIPSTFDISSNVSLSTVINDLNRNEQQKLIQATSILLTGNFISYQNTNEAYSNIGQSLSRRSTYLNPLLSSQVISPLLSNQINALLNSDVSRFDIDFSLNAYNEIDLGVALRLYNDRLILRREGSITGSGADDQTTLTERIGDLNATYRINRSLSVMAFHRQDQTLGNITSSPSTGNTVDGIGLEAQVKFNTWKEFTRKIKNTILRIFGAGKKEESGEDEKLASDGAAESNK